MRWGSPFPPGGFGLERGCGWAPGQDHRNEEEDLFHLRQLSLSYVHLCLLAPIRMWKAEHHCPSLCVRCGHAMAVANGTQDLWQDAEESRSLLEVFPPSWAWWCKGSTDRVSDGRDTASQIMKQKPVTRLLPRTTQMPRTQDPSPHATSATTAPLSSQSYPSRLDPTLL